MISQVLMIMRDLNRGKEIDHMSAFRDYNSWSLRSRIPEVNNRLEQMGKPPVEKRWISKNGKTYRQYFISAKNRIWRHSTTP